MRLPAIPRRRGLLIMLTTTLALLGGCADQVPVSHGQIEAFDTRVDVTLIGIERQRARRVTRQLDDDFQRMHEAWHAWRAGPVSRMNRKFNEGSEPFAAPPSVLPLLQLSKQLAQQSDNLFNPAIGHLVKAWGFQGRATECLRPPPQDLIDEALKANPTMQDVHIDGFRVWSDNDMVKLDFRAIQKGFAIDHAIARLEDEGIENASVAIDGNIRAIGSRDGYPWSITVRGPEGGGIFATLEILGNEAAFTAGEYKRNFAWKGEVYHSIIDPRTGFPAVGTASVTVLHPSSSTANAAANALFVAGPTEWHRIAKQMGIHYVMLTDDEGRVHMNPAMQARVKLHSGTREIVISAPLT